MRFSVVCVAFLVGLVPVVIAQEGAQPQPTALIWPDLAPGESVENTGELLPFNPQEHPPISRVVKIRTPSMDLYPPTTEANGTAVLVLPGGGFGKVVPDLEGSEAAAFLGELGITTFILKYRTSEVTPKEEPKWKRPLQDAQRAMRWIRQHADRWELKQDQIGLLAFSAGGQVGAILITTDQTHYSDVDDTDRLPFRPDFAMLVYPWQCYDQGRDALLPEIKITKQTPPSFIVHTHDDNSTSLGAALLYMGMKKHQVPAELHIYETGGHGYGTRARPNSNIGTWKDRASDWLRRRL